MKRLLCLLLVVGCEGPGATPQLDVFARALVCDVPGASFDAHGINLAGAHIELQRMKTVVDVPVTESILTPPSEVRGDYLHVNVEGLDTGAYDVMAVNGPSASARWTVKNGLGILPPPSVLSEQPANVCNAQSAQMLTVRGSGFVAIDDRVPRVSIRDQQGLERFVADGVVGECVAAVSDVVPGVQLCNTVAITLPSGHLDPGLYVAVVTNPAPLDCSSTETRPFTVAPPPAIFAAQSTATLCQGGGTLDIQGGGFQMGATVALGGVGPISSTQTGDTAITADFAYSPLFVPGQKLSLVVANPDGCRATAVQAITIAPGPVLLAVDPPLAYGKVRTPLTLHLTSVTPAIMSATLIHRTTGTPVTLTAAADPAHATRVIAEVPPNLPTGAYDLRFSDGSNCGTGINNALTIADEVGLTLDGVRPAFGDRAAPQSIMITGSMFVVGARAFLSPHDGGGGLVTPLATQLEGDALQAVVPPGIPAGRYDVLVVNPDGAIGILDNPTTAFQLYQAVDAPVPSVTKLSPLALPPNCAGCLVTLKGAGFGVAGSVESTCYAPGSATPLANPPPFPIQGVPSDSTLVVEGDALADLPHGTACWLRVVNNDGTVKPWGETSQPVVAAGGLAPVKAGDLTLATQPSLTTVRRAPAVVAAQVAPGRRYLYALGGDGGNLSFPRDDVEAAPLGFAGLGTWRSLPRAALPSGTTLAGAVTDGRLIYVVGGHDGMRSLGRVTRAEVLTPKESPHLHDLGVALDFNNAGLDGGHQYWYRVAARFEADDALNPGGESLASPPVQIALSSLAQGFDVQISWTPGDTAGRSVAGWRIYRGQAPDQIDRYLDVAPATLSFTDDGSLMTASQMPLPMGGLGRFRTVGMPQLVTPRAGAAVVLAPDPSVADRWYLYAGFGWSSELAASLPTSYEVAQIDGVAIANFGESSLGGQGRWLLGGWSYSPERHLSANEPHVFFGQGTRNLTLSNFASGDSVMEMNGGKVTSGGALTPMVSPAPVVDVEYGYGTFGGGDRLIMLGGSVDNNSPGPRCWSAPFSASAPLPDAWISNGNLLPESRFLPGVASDGPYLYVVGGGTAFNAASSGVVFGRY